MSRSIVKISALVLYYIVCSSCNNKPKAVSADVTKTAVTVNGKKDSVRNNPKKTMAMPLLQTHALNAL